MAVTDNKGAVDVYTPAHVAIGMVFGMLGVGFGTSMAVAVGYEIIEQFVERSDFGQQLFRSRGPEGPLNVAIDVAVFAAGHWAGSRVRAM
jgi:hypothetical protein